LEGQNLFAEAKLRGERRAGELLKGMDSIKKGKPRKCDSVSHLADLGVSKKESSNWQKLTDIAISTSCIYHETTNSFQRKNVEIYGQLLRFANIEWLRGLGRGM